MLQQKISSLKDNQSKTSVCLEHYENIKRLIKEKYRKILDSTQFIYTSCQEISTDCNSRQSECISAEGKLEKVYENFKAKQMKWGYLEDHLNRKLETLKTSLADEEANLKKEKDQNYSLKLELDSLYKKIQQIKQKAGDLVESEKMREDVEMLNREIETMTTNLDELENNTKIIMEELENKQKNLDQR